MDEVEYRMAYTSMISILDKVTDDTVKHALRQLLQIVDGQQQTIEEMQTEEDDEC